MTYEKIKNLVNDSNRVKFYLHGNAINKFYILIDGKEEHMYYYDIRQELIFKSCNGIKWLSINENTTLMNDNVISMIVHSAKLREYREIVCQCIFKQYDRQFNWLGL